MEYSEKSAKLEVLPEVQIEQNENECERRRHDNHQSLACTLELLELPNPFQLVFVRDLHPHRDRFLRMRYRSCQIEPMHDQYDADSPLLVVSTDQRWPFLIRNFCT